MHGYDTSMYTIIQLDHSHHLS